MRVVGAHELLRGRLVFFRHELSENRRTLGPDELVARVADAQDPKEQKDLGEDRPEEDGEREGAQAPGNRGAKIEDAADEGQLEADDDADDTSELARPVAELVDALGREIEPILGVVGPDADGLRRRRGR